MSSIRNRTKNQLPMVLLTLLSIVQALALELLWSKIRETPALFAWDWTALLLWLQFISSFLGIVVIWIVYANTAMRFRWVPSLSDSIYPFIVGIFEFILVETHTPALLGAWFLCLAAIFAIMIWVGHTKMRRARQDSENAEFFSRVEPARLRDFYAAFGIVSTLLAAGLYLSTSGDRGVIALIAALLALAFLLRQIVVAARFWSMSLIEADTSPDP